MRHAIKQTTFLFLALSLILILADRCFIDNTLNSKYLSVYTECSDVSDTSDHSCSIGFENDYLINDLSIKSDTYRDGTEKMPDLAVQLDSRYILYIWQPPKLS